MPLKRAGWEDLKQWALGLGLPGVEETTSWGQPTLKAHKKNWVWWSPHEDAAVFKVPREEREFLIECDPDTFFCTPHYHNHGLVLVRPERLDPEWAKANLIRVWRDQAPKRFLQAYDEAHGAPKDPRTGETPLPVGLTRPVRRTLENAGYTSLECLAGAQESEIADLPGIGPTALRALKAALKAAGLAFTDIKTR